MPHIPGHKLSPQEQLDKFLSAPTLTPQQQLDRFIGASTQSAGEGSLIHRLGSKLGGAAFQALPGGVGDPRESLKGLNFFERNVIEPIAAAGTVAQAPSALGLAGVPGFQGDFAFNPEQLPGREGFREEFRRNVPLGSRILAEAAFDPLNLAPGVGFTKLPAKGLRGGQAARKVSPSAARSIPLTEGPIVRQLEPGAIPPSLVPGGPGMPVVRPLTPGQIPPSLRGVSTEPLTTPSTRSVGSPNVLQDLGNQFRVGDLNSQEMAVFLRDSIRPAFLKQFDDAPTIEFTRKRGEVFLNISEGGWDSRAQKLGLTKVPGERGLWRLPDGPIADPVTNPSGEGLGGATKQLQDAIRVADEDLLKVTPPPEQAGRQSAPGGPSSPNAPAAPEIVPTSPHTPKLADPTDFKTQLDVTFNPNAARKMGEKLARTPVVGSIIRWANPTLAESSNVGKAGLVRAASIDEGRNRISTFTASQRQHGLQDELFGPTNADTGLLTEGKFKGSSVQEIAENPSKFDLTTQEKLWIDAGDEIEKELLDFYTRNGIPINQVPLDEIERYAGRVHVAQVTPDGEIIAQGSVGKGKNLGGKTSAEKSRSFTTIKEAQDSGFVPLSYQESLRARSQSAWNRVINKQTQAWLEANPGAGVTIRPAVIGEQGSFGNLRDLSFPGKVIEGPSAGQFAAEINEIIRPQAVNSVLKGINSINSVQRIFALAGDASPFMIQLLATMFRHPLVFGKSGVEFNQTFVRALFNPKAARARRARRITEQAEIFQSMPGIIMSDTGLEATEALGKGGLLNNVVIGKPAAVLRPFQQAFEAAMDEAGMHLGIVMKEITGDNPQRLRDATDYVNSMRGLSSSARIGLSPNQRLVESAILLAPRYRRAVAALHANVFQGGLRGEAARRAYLHLAVGLSTTFAGMTIALGLMQGRSQTKIMDDLKAGLDPRNRRFLLWNLGGQAVGPGSKFISDLRMLGKIATDPTAIADLSEGGFNVGARWVRSQLASAPSNTWDLFSGSTYLGEPVSNDFSGNPLDSLKNLGNLVKEDLMPLWVSSVLFEGGTPPERAIRGTGDFLGLRAYQYPDQTVDEVIKELYGSDESFDTLPRKQLNRAIEVWERGLSDQRKQKRAETQTRKKEEEDKIEREFFERQRKRNTR